MTDRDAAEETLRYLHALPANQDISNWNGFTFVTQSGYWRYETTLVNNDTGVYRVRRILARVPVRAWQRNSPGAPFGAPGQLLCQEAGVSASAPGR